MANSSEFPYSNRSNGTSIFRFDEISDDLTDFAETRRFIGEFTRVITITYDVNLGFGILFGLLNLILLSTITNKALRQCSRMWYFYHLVAMVAFTSLILHTIAHAEWIFSEHNRDICYFVMYSILYIFQILGTNIVLINVEVFFTSLLPVASFEKSKFFRFLVVILSSWLLNCLIVTHLIINNNSGRDGQYNCLYVTEALLKTLDYIRTLFPGIVCFLFTAAILGLRLHRRVRGGSFTSHEFSTRTDDSDSNNEWTVCVLVLNALFILRVALEMSLLLYDNLSFGKLFNRRQLTAIVVIHVFRSQCLYLIPMSLFCLSKVRTAVKQNFFKVVELMSFRRLKFGRLEEDIKVKFTNDMNDTDLP